MPFIRIPKKQWGQVWRELVASGPISRVSQEFIYSVSDEQVKLLRRKKLPFELVSVDVANGRPVSPQKPRQGRFEKCPAIQCAVESRGPSAGEVPPGNYRSSR